MKLSIIIIIVIDPLFFIIDQQSCYTPYTPINPDSDGSFTDTSGSGVQLLFPDSVFTCSGYITGINISVKAASHTLGRSLVLQLWEQVNAEKSLYRLRFIKRLSSDSDIQMMGVTVEIVSKKFILPVEAGDIVGIFVSQESSSSRPLSPMYSTIANTSNSSTVYIGYTDKLPCTVALCSSKFQLLESVQYNFAINCEFMYCIFQHASACIYFLPLFF